MDKFIIHFRWEAVYHVCILQAEKNVELKNKKVDYNPYKDDEYGNVSTHSYLHASVVCVHVGVVPA